MSFKTVRIYKKSGYHCFSRVEAIGGTRSDRIGKALWMEDGREIYVTCAYCGEINHLKGFLLREKVASGFGSFLEDVVAPCIICCRCDSGFAAHLEDWEKVSKETRERFTHGVGAWPYRRDLVKEKKP